MKSVCVIPARLESTRFPNKPLVDICGLPMIVRVAKSCLESTKIDAVLVATDSDRIIEVCKSYNVESIKTSSKPRNSSERTYEVSKMIDAEYYIEIQGDEPMVTAEIVDGLIDEVERSLMVVNACTGCPKEEHNNPNIIKVVVDDSWNALYFSRLPIPYEKGEKYHRIKQLGFYAYSKRMIELFNEWGMGPIEASESIHMIRMLEHNEKVRMKYFNLNTISVDVPDDLNKVIEIIKGCRNEL